MIKEKSSRSVQGNQCLNFLLASSPVFMHAGFMRLKQYGFLRVCRMLEVLTFSSTELCKRQLLLKLVGHAFEVHKPGSFSEVCCYHDVLIPRK